MKNTTNKKILLISFLLAFPTMLLFSSLIATEVAADTYIPDVTHPNNDWRWNAEIGSVVYYQNNYTFESPEGMMTNRLLEIYNITGYANISDDMAFGQWALWSHAIGQQLYYNSTADELRPLILDEDPIIFSIASFNYNDSRMSPFETFLMPAQGLMIPFLVPTNHSTDFTTEDIAYVLNKTFYAYFFGGMYNSFDEYGWEEKGADDNFIWFKNNTHDYFLNMTYYDNGSLRCAKGRYLTPMGEGYGNLSFSFKHVSSNYDVLSDTEWGVEKGDMLYYGDHYQGVETEEPTYKELQYKITNITETVVLIEHMGTFSPQNYELVIANVSAWNWGTRSYEQIEEDAIIGFANDLVPVNLGYFASDRLCDKLGEQLESNVQVAEIFLDNITVQGTYPNNATWDGTIIEFLDGMSGEPTGEYLRVEWIAQDWAGDQYAPYNFTLAIDWEYMPQELYGYEFSEGDYFNLYNETEEEGANFFILPKNQHRNDLQAVFNNNTAKYMGFEYILYLSDNEAVLINETEGSGFSVYYNLTNGLPIYEYGVYEGMIQEALFQKYNITISSGTTLEDYELTPIRKRDDNAKISLNSSAQAADHEIYWSFMEFNPSLVPLGNVFDEMPMYLDIYSNLEETDIYFNLTFHYDETKLGGIPEELVRLYYFSNDTQTWEIVPYPMPGTVELDTVNDLFTVKTSTYNLDMMSIWMFALGYETPFIQATFPNQGDVFNATAPRFTVEIVNSTETPIDDMWYEINDGNIYETDFFSENGTIAQGIWNSMAEGLVEVQFFVNDTEGKQNSTDVITIEKDITAPSVSITLPTPSKVFNATPPSFEVEITDENLEEMWYTLDGGLTNTTFTDNGSIDSDIWGDITSDGPLTLTFYGRDSADNIDSASVSIEKDTTAPGIVINSPTDSSVFNSTPPAFEVVLSDPNLADRWYTLDGGLTNTTFTDNGTIDPGEWGSISADGPLTLTFYANDTVGNIGTASVDIELDSTIPTVNILTPEAGLYFGANPPSFIVEMTDLNLESFWYNLNNGENKTFYSNGTIDDGLWEGLGPTATVTLTFYANDSAGNEGSDTVIIEKDIYAPSVTINLPVTDTEFGANPLTFNVFVNNSDDSMWYTLDGGLTNTTFTGNGTIDPALWASISPDGPTTLTFYANDSSGKLSSDSVLLILDTAPPEITINSPGASDSIGDTAPSFEVEFRDNNTISARWYTLNLGTTIYPITSNDSINADAWSALDDGEVIIRFYAMDQAGNQDYEEVKVQKDTGEAVDDDDDDDDEVAETPEIPGYNIVFLVAIIGFISILWYRQKRIKY